MVSSMSTKDPNVVQAAEQAQRIRDKRREQANLDGEANDMEKAQDFLKAGNVKVFCLAQGLWCRAFTKGHSMCNSCSTSCSAYVCSAMLPSINIKAITVSYRKQVHDSILLWLFLKPYECPIAQRTCFAALQTRCCCSLRFSC